MDATGKIAIMIWAFGIIALVLAIVISVEEDVTEKKYSSGSKMKSDADN